MAAYHPHIVHFAIALASVGVGFRLLTFVRRFSFAGLARAGALSAQGNKDAAKGILQTLQGEFPDNQQVRRRLEELAR